MSEGRLAKPQLRHYHLQLAKKNFVIAGLLVASAGFCFKVFVCDAHENKMEQFYKDYDPEKAVERLDKTGLMQSTPA